MWLRLPFHQRSVRRIEDTRSNQTAPFAASSKFNVKSKTSLGSWNTIQPPFPCKPIERRKRIIKVQCGVDDAVEDIACLSIRIGINGQRQSNDCSRAEKRSIGARASNKRSMRCVRRARNDRISSG